MSCRTACDREVRRVPLRPLLRLRCCILPRRTLRDTVLDSDRNNRSWQTTVRGAVRKSTVIGLCM